MPHLPVDVPVFRSGTLLAAAGLVAVVLLAHAMADARASDLPEMAGPSPHASAPAHLRCRLFSVPIETGGELDTRDATTEIGQWLESVESEGWRLHSLDFEIGQKPTGFMQGYQSICVAASP